MNVRRLNSNTDQSSESWPLVLLATQLAKETENFKSAIYLMSAYAHAILKRDTNKPTELSSYDKLFTFIRGLLGLEVLPDFYLKNVYLLQAIDPLRYLVGLN